MNRVFVVDKNEEPLMPCYPARARQLLKGKRAVVYRHRPFTIKLLDRCGGETQPIAVKVDPGYKMTGIAVVADFESESRVIWAAEIEHRGHVVKKRLDNRRMIRRGRRSRKLRYRSPRFLNRRNKFNKLGDSKWLPPSVKSRIANVETWITRLRRWLPVTSLNMELNKFDTQKMDNPEISGVEYQRGELQGYEAWQYLLEKWERRCAYCGADDVPLEREHIVPKSRGGSNRISNLTLSCRKCNQEKGAQTAEEYGYPEVQVAAKKPLKAAAAMNVTRWELYRIFNNFGLPVEIGTGGMTAYNRERQEYEKAHWIDAACVGATGACVAIDGISPVFIKAIGRGSRQICITNKYGNAIKHRARHRENNGFRTGDLVRACPQRGRRAGNTYISTIISNASRPSLILRCERNFFVHFRHCRLLQRADGYDYS